MPKPKPTAAIPPITPPPKLNRQAAANYLGCAKATLDCWACDGRGPKFFKSGRKVWYLVKELDRWIEERSTNCSSALSE